jgi:hypothetical protein
MIRLLLLESVWLQCTEIINEISVAKMTDRLRRWDARRIYSLIFALVGKVDCLNEGLYLPDPFLRNKPDQIMIQFMFPSLDKQGLLVFEGSPKGA